MTSNEFQLVYGPPDAKHLIIGNSLVKHWGGKRGDGTVFGDGLSYGVFSRSGGKLHQLLTDVATILSGIPEEDKASRTCIVQVIITRRSILGSDCIDSYFCALSAL